MSLQSALMPLVDGSAEKYVTATDASVKSRQRIEILIARAFVTAVFEDESNVFSIRVNNGRSSSPRRKDVESVLGDMFSVDEEHVTVYKLAGMLGEKESWTVFGSVFFVYGNDGWDVINDYGANLEFLMEGDVKLLQEHFGG